LDSVARHHPETCTPGTQQAPGTHANSLDKLDFTTFLVVSLPHDFDVMLEILDKEARARMARHLAASDTRFRSGNRNHCPRSKKTPRVLGINQQSFSANRTDSVGKPQSLGQ
jgi:hypothetical protein